MDQFKKMLIEKRESLINNIKSFDKDITTASSVVDTLDFAAGETNKNLLSALKQKDVATLSQVMAALNRINTGEYGKCTECQDEIAQNRLTVRPWVTTCFDCQEELDVMKRKYNFNKSPSEEDVG